MREIEVLQPARSRMVVPLDLAKSELGIADDSQDARLGRLITALGTSFAADQYLARPPWRERVTERLACAGQQHLFLSRWPIETVHSVAVDGQSIDAADYSIAGVRRDRIYRASGWPDTAAFSAGLVPGEPYPGTERLLIEVDYTAGWLVSAGAEWTAGAVRGWAAEAEVPLGAWASPSGWVDGDLLFEATTGGGTDSSEPTWPTESGETVADGAVVWTARPARLIPPDLQEAALAALASWHGGSLTRDGSLQSETDGSTRLVYRNNGGGAGVGFLPASVEPIVRAWR